MWCECDFTAFTDPWDAAAYGRDIRAHEILANECAGEGSSSWLKLGIAASCGALIAAVLCRKMAP
jgi:hypothetical protein